MSKDNPSQLSEADLALWLDYVNTHIEEIAAVAQEKGRMPDELLDENRALYDELDVIYAEMDRRGLFYNTDEDVIEESQWKGEK